MRWSWLCKHFMVRRRATSRKLCTLPAILLTDTFDSLPKTTSAHQIWTCWLQFLSLWLPRWKSPSYQALRSWFLFFLPHKRTFLRDKCWSIWKSKSWEPSTSISTTLVHWSSLSDINVFSQLTRLKRTPLQSKFTILLVNCLSTCNVTKSSSISHLLIKPLPHYFLQSILVIHQQANWLDSHASAISSMHLTNPVTTNNSGWSMMKVRLRYLTTTSTSTPSSRKTPSQFGPKGWAVQLTFLQEKTSPKSMNNSSRISIRNSLRANLQLTKSFGYPITTSGANSIRCSK